MRLLATVLACFLALGCVGPLAELRGPGVDEPQRVVRQYLEAIYAGRAREAWATHSARTNRGERFEEFEQAVQVAAQTARAARIERMETKRHEADRASVEVTQRLGDRQSTYTFELVREGEGWKIDNPRR